MTTPKAAVVRAPLYDVNAKDNNAPADEVKCTIKGCRFSSSNPLERDHHLKVCILHIVKIHFYNAIRTVTIRYHLL